MSKPRCWLSLLAQHPVEFYDRLCAKAQIWAETDSYILHPTLDWGHAARVLALELGGDPESILNEPALGHIESAVRSRIQQLPANKPFPLVFNSDFSLARFCYVACRLLKPVTVVETGVCYGVGSAFFLQALQVNGQGHLYSIDLPALGRNPDDYVGAVVPEALRARWTVKLGTAKRLLPKLLEQTGPVDMFFHDSLHTSRNMALEFRLVEEHLSRPAILIADDIHGNSAFRDWARRTHPHVSGAVQEGDKRALFGFAMTRPDEAQAASTA